MGKLNDICNSIKSFEGYNFSDDMILDCATRIFNSGNMQEKKSEFKTDVPMKKATDKQKGMLDKLKIKYPEDISLMEASELIKGKVGTK